MTGRNDVFVSALVETLVRSGVRHACISPGSRNTPLSIAFAAHPDIEDWSIHDERSGSFVALGLAVMTGTPVAVVTTSGTAAVELHPAVVEADASGVPLILLTADRPAELHDVAAPQTVDQRSLFGGAVRWHHDMEASDPDVVSPRAVAALAARLVQESTSTPAGPVHLNLRFREPLLVTPDFTGFDPPAIGAGEIEPPRGAIDELASLTGGHSGIVVAGPSRIPGLAEAVVTAARALGWPVLSDPISGVRAGDHDTGLVVGSDLLAAGGLLERLTPRAAIRVGAPPTSKALRHWLATSSIPQAVIGSSGWADPDSSASLVLRAHPPRTLMSLADRVEPVDSAWQQRWIEAHRAAAAAADDVIDTVGEISEPAVARALATSVPDATAIWTGSSMPIRDVDSFFPVTARPIGVFGNRGANGIDGFASTAVGSAASGRPTVAHLGDVSMLHDIGALATAARLDLPVTFLVVNNDGGGIFHFLPQEGHEHFERHFGTPHGLRFCDVAHGFGLQAARVESAAQLCAVLAETGSGPRLVEVVTDRHDNVALHKEIGRRVQTALTAA